MNVADLKSPLIAVFLNTLAIPCVWQLRPELCPQVIKKKYPTDGSEIVLLTDGEDNTISACFAEVKQSGAIIHTVALGPSAAKELEELSQMTGEGWLVSPLHCPFHWTVSSSDPGSGGRVGRERSELTGHSALYPEGVRH